MFNGLGRSLRAVAAIAASVLGMTALADRTRPDIPWREIPRLVPVKPKIRQARGSTFGGKYGTKHYAREMARRVRQIERGQLTPSNGLISERNAGIKVNSHGRVETICRPCQARVSTPDGPGECDFPNCADVRPNGCAS